MAIDTKQIILRTGAGTPTTLAEAELGFATDTKTLFVGTGSGTVKTLEEKGHTHTKSNITDFAHDHDDRYYTETEVDTLLVGKAAATHQHDDRYYTETEVDTLLVGKAAATHQHDDRYYTETAVDTLLVGKAAATHQHDDRYYTETEMNTLLVGKANTIHGHTLNYNYIGQVNSDGAHNFAAIGDYQAFFIDIYAEWEDGFMKTSGIVGNNNYGAVTANIFDTLQQAMCYLSASIHPGQLVVTSDGQMFWSLVTGATKYFTINLYGVSVS